MGVGSPPVSGEALNRFLLILNDRIFDPRVDRGLPNLTAAPVGPDTRPRVSNRRVVAYIRGDDGDSAFFQAIEISARRCTFQCSLERSTENIAATNG